MTGGSFANDSLMLLAMSCSPQTDPKAAAELQEEYAAQSKKAAYLERQMYEMGGIKRTGTTEEQEAMIDRKQAIKLRKRRAIATEKNADDV